MKRVICFCNRILGRFLILGALFCLLSACSNTGINESTCVTCHRGLELASQNHQNCVDCHGGDPRQEDKEISHAAMYGPKNPADPGFWEQTCGQCHSYQLKRVQASLMLTNTGMIKNIQQTWEGDDRRQYGTDTRNVSDDNGRPQKLISVRHLDNLAGDLYRKFCSQCHIGREANGKYSASHSSGCAACHFPYNDTATYQGGDATVKDRWPHSADHRLEALPGNDVCLRCHNRSGRVALTYQGLYDGNNGMVPTRNGLPGPRIISGARNVVHITADVHFQKGMDCIDCHTSRDVMGDGYAYKNMYRQTEVACQNCHGSGKTRPVFREISRENDEAVRESKNYQLKMRPGSQMVLTEKQRQYSNVFYRAGQVFVLGKRSGKIFKSPVITGSPEHTIAGHERLECYACHSKAVPQCFGCHTKYDRTLFAKDYIQDRVTRGKFSETEDHRRLYPFALAVNQHGRISPVTPGCQTFVTVIDQQKRAVKKEYVAEFKGKHQLRFAPFYSHNTGMQAVGCSECHGNPAFLGFGQHVVEKDNIRATLTCEKSGQKPLDGFLVMSGGRVTAFAGITRENSRPLFDFEIKRTLAVNQCLVCHDDAKDPIYQQKLDYSVLSSCLKRSGLPDIHTLAPEAAATLSKKTIPQEKARPPVDGALNYEGIFQQAMGTRASEKAFAQKVFGRQDPSFFQKNCQGCHVKSCLDCHDKNDGTYTTPESERCLDCHNGYHVGMDYYGRAPREDSLRYQRGKVYKGEPYLSMLPDVHAQAGMQCADCHSMPSLIDGRRSSKTCSDCHQPNPAVIEHGIAAHLKKLECYACHSAWAAQEYGTFYIRTTDSPNRKYFRLRPSANDQYLKSAYLKQQNAPPLGLNNRGKISPVRPQFIIYFSDINNNKPVGKENRLLAAQWKALFPHTIRRGAVMCDGCHGNARRFLLEKKAKRLYELPKDDMVLFSFWDQNGQALLDGSFMPPERFAKMAAPLPAYRQAYLKKWKKLLQSVANSSKP